MIPIRCLSCGKPVSAHFDEYTIRMIGGKQLFHELEDRDLVQEFMEQLTIEKKEANEILSNLGLNRYCCRRMLISHVETWE